jgi:hypothetical protein
MPFSCFDLTQAMFLGLASLFVRQFGHAVPRAACHDEEARLLGYNTRNKTLIAPRLHAHSARAPLRKTEAWSFSGFLSLTDPDRRSPGFIGP